MPADEDIQTVEQGRLAGVALPVVDPIISERVWAAIGTARQQLIDGILDGTRAYAFVARLNALLEIHDELVAKKEVGQALDAARHAQ